MVEAVVAALAVAGVVAAGSHVSLLYRTTSKVRARVCVRTTSVS